MNIGSRPARRSAARPASPTCVPFPVFGWTSHVRLFWMPGAGTGLRAGGSRYGKTCGAYAEWHFFNVRIKREMTLAKLSRHRASLC